MIPDVLNTYWISFPEDKYFTYGFGITAFTVDDAFWLLEQFNFCHHKTAKRVEIKENITWDELDVNHVQPNVGPITVRGIWYPNLNLGLIDFRAIY